jgi:CHASE2 domain-containing sensor protein
VRTVRLVDSTRSVLRSRSAWIYGVSLLVVLGLSQTTSIFDVTSPLDSRPAALIYRTALQIGRPVNRAQRVHLVLISEETEPETVVSGHSTCKQRDFMARLLQRVMTASPKVVVIDKSYEETCSPLEDEQLSAAITDVASQIPIVVGTFDISVQELPPSQTRKENLEALDSRNAVVLKESDKNLRFGPNVYFGLLVLDSDERRIPLRWPVVTVEQYERSSAAELMNAALKTKDTLSVQATLLFRNASKNDAIRVLASGGVPPLTNFLRENSIPSHSAIDLICGKEGSKLLDWRGCKPDADLTALNNRVVIIGEKKPGEDEHGTSRTPGVILQANYIESLLEGRYFRPASFLLELAVSILSLLVAVAVFARCSGMPFVALLISVVTIVLVAAITYGITLRASGPYIESTAWAPVMLAAAGQYILQSDRRARCGQSGRAECNS